MSNTYSILRFMDYGYYWKKHLYFSPHFIMMKQRPRRLPAFLKKCQKKVFFEYEYVMMFREDAIICNRKKNIKSRINA